MYMIVLFTVLVNGLVLLSVLFVRINKRGVFILCDLYKTIKTLCDARGTTVSAMCLALGMSKSIMSDLKKGESGKNRVIPIHPELRPVIEQHLSREERLFPLAVKSDGDIHAAQRSSFTRRWTALMEELGMKHTTHECRHTFRSKLDSAGANKVAIDLIMGHKSGDIGERVYTHKTLSELQEAIRKLSYGLPVSNA